MKLPIVTIMCVGGFLVHASPRGCLQLVADFLAKYGVELSITDERCKGKEVDLHFSGQLSILQDAAARSILAHDTGILSATTAFGKTVVAAFIIASRKVNTLVLVHRRELMDHVDIQVPLLMSMYKKRIKGYRAMGYSGMEL